MHNIWDLVALLVMQTRRAIAYAYTFLIACCPTGSWLSAGYHLGTTIAVPVAILPLPFAFSQLGWEAGIIALLLGTCTTYYASIRLASLFNWDGQTYYRYRDLAKSVYGGSTLLLVTCNVHTT